FRYRFEGETVPLPANGIYRNEGDYWTDAPVALSDTCANGICTGMIAVYSLPDNNDSLHYRTVTEVAGTYKGISGCWPTENREGIELREYLFKITFDAADLTGEALKPQRFSSQQEDWGFGPVERFEFYAGSEQAPGVYRAYLYEVAYPNPWFGSFYVQHPATEIPSFSNMYYSEAFPPIIVDSAVDMTIVFDFGTEDQLLFQPFTGVRGALVDGSDSIRHHLTLEFDQPNICQIIWVDVIAPDNTTYLLGSGSYEFANSQSCFMFMDGGKLAIKENAEFHYGDNGVGVLGLSREGWLELRKGATFEINNKLALVAPNGGPSEQAYVRLAPGSTLRFGPAASLYRTQGKNMDLNVFMDGGVLDDSELSAEERSLIRRIYPNRQPPVAGLARVSPNPSTGVDMILWTEVEATDPLPYKLYDNLGRLLDHGQAEAMGNGRFHLPDQQQLPPGVYRILIEGPTGSIRADWIKR
ncbi:MAG: hypothetical protein AAGA62_13240, partial [Bacteroidota bacterium]